MTHIFKIALALSVSAAAFAGDAVETQWNQVCRVADGREIVVTTDTGTRIEGYCVAVDVDGMKLRTRNGNITSVARKTLTRLEMYRAKGHQLSALGKGMRNGLKFGFETLLTPAAPIGLIAIPSTLAWGAATAPFCALGDLVYRTAGKREIKAL